MKAQPTRRSLRCAIYTRVSTDQGLEQDFNSLDAQREASEAYIKSQAHEGWMLLRARYDDGGFSGGSMDRPALRKLLSDVEAERIDVIVVYRVDRLTRSLGDFASRVGDWRAGLGRSLCSLLARSFVCECHTISTVPRFQLPPRRTQHADFLALRSPVCFAPRLMGPIPPVRLSVLVEPPGSH